MGLFDRWAGPSKKDLFDELRAQGEALRDTAKTADRLSADLEQAHRDRTHFASQLMAANERLLKLNAAILDGSRRAIDVMKERKSVASGEELAAYDAVLAAMHIIHEAAGPADDDDA